MKILITGAAGFLGSNIVESFQQEGYDIVATSRNEQKFKAITAISEQTTFIQADLSDKEAMRKFPNDITHIVHCAAFSSPWGTYEKFYRNNVKATENVLTYAKGLPNFKRFVHISTPSIYFGYEAKEDVGETERKTSGFLNDYAKTKYEAELLFESAFQTEGFPFVGIRPRAIYGERDTTILRRLIEANEKTGVPFINNGEHLMDMTYVKNVVHSVELAIQANETVDGKFYNITNGDVRTFNEVMEIVFQHLDKPFKKRKISAKALYVVGSMMERLWRFFKLESEPRVTRYTASVLTHTQTLSIENAKKDLGYVPKFTTEEGVRRYANWYKREG